MTERSNNGDLVVLLRHGEREAAEFPRHDAPLTPRGRQSAREFGEVIGPRLGTVHTSPVHRCVETSAHLLLGSGTNRTAIHDTRLGDPGVYVVDGDRAMVTLQTIGLHAAAARVGAGEHLAGFAEPDAATALLILLCESLLRGYGRSVHVLVSHDLIIAAFAGRLLGRPLEAAEWPVYLDGVLLWMRGEELEIAYGGLNAIVPKTLRPQRRS